MSSWSEKTARVNVSQLREFGSTALLANPGAPMVPFTAVRLQRQQLENESAGAFEQIWTTTVALTASAVVGGTVTLGAVEYLIQDVKPDADPDSNGFTIYLNRKRPINA